MRELDDFEDGIIDRFRRHPVLRAVGELPEDAFHEILLQRRFISHVFTNVYDLAIDALTDERARRIARVIVREEYPDDDSRAGHLPSHREDMKEDILRLGVGRRQLLASEPSATTARVTSDLIALIREAGLSERPDVELVTILRLWGEILVSVEYGQLWPRMESRLVVDGENRSLFYYPHLRHDAKTRPLARASLLSTTHSDQLGMRLSQLLESPVTWDDFRRVETAVVGIRTDFYDQFRPLLPATEDRADQG